MKIFFAALFVLCLYITSVCAQQASNPPGDFTAPSEAIRGEAPPNADRPPREHRVLKQGPLAPSANDQLAYASFLRHRDTGLIRLLPRELQPNRMQAKIPDGGAYYSFADLTHVYGYSDLQLERNTLSVGLNGANYGMLINFGDVSLADITLKDPRVRFMAAYHVPKRESVARLEYKSFQQGLTVDGGFYRSRLPVTVNATYGLRSINYGHSDVLVAFRVVRKDPDGSIIILWKLLKHYPDPGLKQGK